MYLSDLSEHWQLKLSLESISFSPPWKDNFVSNLSIYRLQNWKKNHSTLKKAALYLNIFLNPKLQNKLRVEKHYTIWDPKQMYYFISK